MKNQRFFLSSSSIFSLFLYLVFFAFKVQAQSSLIALYPPDSEKNESLYYLNEEGICFKIVERSDSFDLEESNQEPQFQNLKNKLNFILDYISKELIEFTEDQEQDSCSRCKECLAIDF